MTFLDFFFFSLAPSRPLSLAWSSCILTGHKSSLYDLFNRLGVLLLLFWGIEWSYLRGQMLCFSNVL